MLNEMRFGTLTPASIETFKSLSRVPDNSDGIDPTELFVFRFGLKSQQLTRFLLVSQ